MDKITVEPLMEKGVIWLHLCPVDINNIFYIRSIAFEKGAENSCPAQFIKNQNLAVNSTGYLFVECR